MAVRMELARILIQETEDTHIIELREVDGDRIFPITIGLSEAVAIERRLMGHEPPRPQTHELLANVIDATGFRLDRIIINELKQRTFFARLHLRNRETDQLVDIDSRPSDAIALGVAANVPILVEEQVLDEVNRPD